MIIPADELVCTIHNLPDPNRFPVGHVFEAKVDLFPILAAIHAPEIAMKDTVDTHRVRFVVNEYRCGITRMKVWTLDMPEAATP